jgi:hypothetical protein
MSTSAPAAKAKKKLARPAGLPDERFWIKYSQNHELPLSVTSSLFIHALALGFVGLVLAGVLAGLFTKQRRPEVMAVSVAGGGGGDPNGSVESPGAEAINPGTEAAKQTNAKPETISPIEPKDLKVPPVTEKPLIDSAEVVRMENLKPMSAAADNLSAEIKKAQDRVAAARTRAKGQGGQGTGGGLGDGTGTGIGNSKGPGAGAGSITQSRKARWTLLFTTSSPLDYLHQLRDLGAIIAIPEPDGRFLVFRDLKVTPLVGRIESGAELPLISYSDNEPASVSGLAKLLHLRSTPAFFMAFFDQKLENQLLELEKRQYSGDENNIAATFFQFDRIGNGKFRPRVREIRYNNR